MKPNWIKLIKAIGWDLDGTFYHPNSFPKEIIHRKQYEAVANKNNWSIDKAKKEYNKIYKQLGSNTKTINSFGIDGVKFFTSVWDEIDLKQYLKPDPNLNKLFNKLNSKINTHFIISNSNRTDQVLKKLAVLNLDPNYFKFIISTVELGSVKPDPAPFLKALEKLKLKPSEVLFVGDRVNTDVNGAQAVGMKTCLVWGSSKQADVSQPTVYDVVKLF